MSSKTKTNNKRDIGALSSCLPTHKVPGPLCRAAGRAGGAIWGGLHMVMLSNLGQRCPSSYPGLEYIPEGTVHTMPWFWFCG